MSNSCHDFHSRKPSYKDCSTGTYLFMRLYKDNRLPMSVAIEMTTFPDLIAAKLMLSWLQPIASSKSHNHVGSPPAKERHASLKKYLFQYHKPTDLISTRHGLDNSNKSGLRLLRHAALELGDKLRYGDALRRYYSSDLIGSRQSGRWRTARSAGCWRAGSGSVLRRARQAVLLLFWAALSRGGCVRVAARIWAALGRFGC